MSDDLVERVARALVSPKADPSDWRFWTDEARAAIAVVLEEAAKVCDAIETKLSDQWRANYKVCDYTQGASDGANDCAAAIRALIKEPV